MTATNGCAAGTGNDTVNFSVTGTIALTSALPQITDTLLTINGPAASGITIDGGGEVQVMQVASRATVNLGNLTISNGFDFGIGGGGVNNKGALTVINSTFSGNSATPSAPGPGMGGDGGAIWNSGTLTVTSSTFSENKTGSGDGIWNQGTLAFASYASRYPVFELRPAGA
jgi:hypothetical protein